MCTTNPTSLTDFEPIKPSADSRHSSEFWCVLEGTLAQDLLCRGTSIGAWHYFQGANGFDFLFDNRLFAS
jgi:hypothetical protein